MNVEIGTETTQFPEKEYINEFLLQCGEFKKVCLLLDDEKYIHLFKLKTTLSSTMLNH
jgi:hypothetical protein